jgi:cell division ATPase FtsA
LLAQGGIIRHTAVIPSSENVITDDISILFNHRKQAELIESEVCPPMKKIKDNENRFYSK